MLAALATMLWSSAAIADSGDTLKTVLERGALNCTGHNGSYLGMTEIDDQGNWSGFDIDLCRALSAGLFGTSEGHLEIVPLSWAQRWPSLQSGDVDVIIKTTGVTLSRDTEVGLAFTRPYMLNSVNYMTHTKLGVEKPSDLDGGTICLQAGTTFERYFAAHSESNDYSLKVVPFERTEEMKAAFEAGRCDAIMDWDLQLAVFKETEAANPDDFMIVPGTIAAEPVGIATRQGDANWSDINNWMLSFLIMAEEENITRENVDEVRANPPSASVAKLLGTTPGIGEVFGLSDDWVYNMIKEQGNYSEIWDRNIGAGSIYKLERGVNALVRDGGVHFSLILD
ncbi:transporter substrate-binding domain-containing protein [Roseovarius sp. ZX-A-9]|uniref:transporter substrate-binding domain-containing protein n=1 Tax=Roseovarius sp. ZX-A-9 TaxID=3014783 RepID=UPI00232FA0A0|nr:transporter substrate-binding domain-containing protein [Roseovarius sp. ZX-A-9]